MAASVAYIDFSKIYLTRSELKLLRDICGTPLRRKAEDQTEEAERLRDLGLIEVFENRGNGRQGLFATELGRAYCEYSVRARRTRFLEVLKWVIPLVLSIAALVLAIRANYGLGGNNGRTTGVVSSQTNQQRNDTSNANNQAASSESGSASQDPQNGSAEPQAGAQNTQNASSEPQAGAQNTQNASSEPQAGAQDPQNASSEPQPGAQNTQNTQAASSEQPQAQGQQPGGGSGEASSGEPAQTQ